MYNMYTFRHYSLKCVVLVALVITFTFSSCGIDANEELGNQIKVAIRGTDKAVTQVEYETIVAFIKSNRDKLPQFFEGEEIKPEKVVSYILDSPLAQKKGLTTDDVYSPSSDGNATDTDGKFNVNVFIENSGSMDGYVKGVTGFEIAIYDFLGDVQRADFCDSLNLNYINNQIHEFYKLKTQGKPKSTKKGDKPVTQQDDNLPEQVRDFIEKLEPETFRKRGGDRSKSDLQQVLKNVVSHVNENNAVLFVSDCVFSLGDPSKDARDFLLGQKIGLGVAFDNKLDQMGDFEIIIYQLQSKFTGNYIDRYEQAHLIDSLRPYYLFVMGSHKQIETFIDEKIIDDIEGGYMHRVMFSEKAKQEVAYRILPNPKIGNFELGTDPKKDIIHAGLSRDKVFQFHVLVDFSGIKCMESYLAVPSSYEYPEEYKLEIKPITEAMKKKPSHADYTHELILTTDKIRNESIEIYLKNMLPEWVEKANSDDDTKIERDKIEMTERTFGIKYLIGGVFDAYKTHIKNDYLSTITINISK